MEYTKEINLNNIKITDKFKKTMPTVHKFRDKYYCLRHTNVLPDKIIVDEDYTLVDGYISYLLAKAFGYTEVEVVIKESGNTDEYTDETE